MVKTALIVTSVASMIDQFNKPNIELLKRMGFQVTVATNFENPGNLTKDKVEDLFNYFKQNEIEYIQVAMDRFPFTLNNLKVLRKLSQLINENKYDIIHCQSPVGGVLTRIAARKWRKSVIYTAHGFHFFEGASKFNWLIYYPIEYLLSRYTNTLITINQEDYKRSLNFRAKNQVYIPGVGIDTGKISELDINKESYRDELNLKTIDLVLLSVGELNENKNHRVVLEALSTMNLSHVHYVICGMGELREELIDYSRKLCISNQVHFLGFRTDVLNLMQVSDIFMFPSFREGLPFSLMEAMASGLPAIVSDIRGNCDLIMNDAGGRLIDPSAPDIWATNIEELLSNPELRASMSDYNLKKIKNFDIHKINEKMAKIYAEVGEL
ncbi:glycosyltransferase family 4 protein [Aerococcus sp. L_32]|uniref:glycosyltransferase family 4 protein n=1 Tax=Aerococcus sp. L_32 TaxID=3422316 RepID=UPI003D6C1BAB